MKEFIFLNNNHVCKLPSDIEYKFSILKACFSQSGTILQLMIALESKDELVHDVILEEIEVSSPTFALFVSRVYQHEISEVIDLDLNKITVTSGLTRIKRNNETDKVSIIWEDTLVLKSPYSSAYRHRVRYNENVDSWDDSCVDDSEASEFVILKNNHVCNLPTNIKYDFYIIRACFNQTGDSLQMMVFLENEENNLKDVIYEECRMDFDVFNRIVKESYAVETGKIIDFSPERLNDFFGKVSLMQVGDDICIDWSSVDIGSSPLSSAGTLRLEWLEKDEINNSPIR